jgi:hypothetical protein
MLTTGLSIVVVVEDDGRWSLVCGHGWRDGPSREVKPNQAPKAKARGKWLKRTQG